ncbi:VOC family protein [Pseudonocardia nigra]|uniref:VOC family protein n=1 Tax=Pseudonocardia nigra TaxID=1921578 RepID=UPI001C5CD012|nr:VOC family protein [Pseudonocardia nigra]
MTFEHTLRPVPEGYTTVTPWMISRDTAGVLDFLHRAFGAEELARVQNPDGSIGHAEARIGDAVVMLFDGRPEWPATPCFLRLYLPDGDAAFRRALDAGATVVTEMTEMFWGDRVGRVRDPFGNLYWIQTRVAEPDAEEVQRRMAAPEFVAAMEYVQSPEIVAPVRTAG